MSDSNPHQERCFQHNLKSCEKPKGKKLKKFAVGTMQDSARSRTPAIAHLRCFRFWAGVSPVRNTPGSIVEGVILHCLLHPRWILSIVQMAQYRWTSIMAILLLLLLLVVMATTRWSLWIPNPRHLEDWQRTSAFSNLITKRGVVIAIL